MSNWSRKGYFSHPPPPIKARVKNSKSMFEWMTAQAEKQQPKSASKEGIAKMGSPFLTPFTDDFQLEMNEEPSLRGKPYFGYDDDECKGEWKIPEVVTQDSGYIEVTGKTTVESSTETETKSGRSIRSKSACCRCQGRSEKGRRDRKDNVKSAPAKHGYQPLGPPCPVYRRRMKMFRFGVRMFALGFVSSDRMIKSDDEDDEEDEEN